MVLVLKRPIDPSPGLVAAMNMGSFELNWIIARGKLGIKSKPIHHHIQQRRHTPARKPQALTGRLRALEGVLKKYFGEFWQG